MKICDRIVDRIKNEQDKYYILKIERGNKGDMIKDKQILINKVNVRDNAKFSVEVPGSKSITNRALLIAALADGKTTVKGALFSDDSRHFLKCLIELGYEVEINEDMHQVSVRGLSGQIPKDKAKIYVGSAGTAARFLTAMLSFSGEYYIDASEQMKKRPMAPLIESLRELGADISYHEKEGHFPFTIKGNGQKTDRITVNIDNSSQFLSALLIVSTMFERDMDIEVVGTHGMAYIDITLKMMEQFGVKVEKNGNIYHIKAGQTYRACEYDVEPDVSAACYFYAMSPLLNVRACVKGVKKSSMQGDIRFVDILEKAGCVISTNENGDIEVMPPERGNYEFGTVDMGSCSDQTMTLAVLAPFAKNVTKIKGIGHIRLQESDRIKATKTELVKMGIRCEDEKDSLTIYPGEVTNSIVETYEDHRIAMSFALIGLKNGGITIDNPSCCRKTFEDYFEKLYEVIDKIKK